MNQLFWVSLLSACCTLAVPLRAQSLRTEFFEFRVEESGKNRYEVTFINNASCDITVDFDMKLENLVTAAALPFTMTLRGWQEVKALELRVVDKGKTARYQTQYRYTFGNQEATHDTGYVYQLPYKPGSAHRVVQGYFGGFSHDESSHYAVDFEMPDGTEVYAAREGVVVGYYEGSDKGGPHTDYMKSTNYIFIRHSDLTIGAYYHLKRNGALVRIGQTVKRGDLIGYSGHTGFTFGPHLHFEVFKALNGTQQLTFLLKFDTLSGIVKHPLEGHSYVAR